jgi:small-conductance mechanosensitive channel
MKEFLEIFKDVINYPLFSINQTQVSPLIIFIFIFILLCFYFLAKIISSKVLSKILSKFNLEEGLMFTLIRISHYLVISIGALVAFQFVGIDLSGLAVILGFLSVGIGFGLQNVTSNFISGLILLFERPIKVGDRVTVGDTVGYVTNIKIRATTIRTLNNISIIVPNSDFISNNVINWTHGDKKIRIELKVGVSYSSDLDLVLSTLKKVALENNEVLKDPEPEVHLLNFGDSSWEMNLRVWIPDPRKYYYVCSDLNCEIVRNFRKNGIEIPFPQRDLHLRSVDKDTIKQISK